MVGVMANGLAVVVNAGWMPYYPPALEAAGLTVADLSPARFFTALPMDIGAGFLLQAGPFGDVVPLPVPYLRTSSASATSPSPSGWAGSCWRRCCVASRTRRRVASRCGPGSTTPRHEAEPLDARPVHARWGQGTGSRGTRPGRRSRRHHGRHPSCRPPAGSIGSGTTRTCACCAMPASPRSGWARPSACSATGSTSSRSECSSAR